MPVKLPNDINELIALPIPEKSNISRLSTKNLFKASQHYLKLWKNTLDDYNDIIKKKLKVKCAGCGEEYDISGKDLWCRIFLITGRFYEFTVRRLIINQNYCRDPEEDLVPGLNIPALSNFLKQFPNKKCNIEKLIGHIIIADYLSCLIPTYFTGLFRTIPIPSPPINLFEKQSHENIVDLNEKSMNAPHRDLRRISQICVHGLLELLMFTYSKGGMLWDKRHKLGPFSSK